MRLYTSLEISHELEIDYKSANKHGAFDELIAYELCEKFFKDMFDRYKGEVRKTVDHNIYNELEPGQTRYNTRTIVLDVLTLKETSDIMSLLKDITYESNLSKREEIFGEIREKFKI